MKQTAQQLNIPYTTYVGYKKTTVNQIQKH